MASILNEITGKIPFTGGRGLTDAVVLNVGSNAYDAWESMRITRSIESLSASFAVTFADKWRSEGTKWPLKPGEEVRVFIGLTPVLTGYIDKLDVSVSANDRSLTISGRDRTGDLVDCTPAATTPREFSNQNLLTIANTLCREFGITVTSTAPGALTPIKKWALKEAETVFENLDRGAKSIGAYLSATDDGNLEIIDRSSLSAQGSKITDVAGSLGIPVGQTTLRQGVNILSASATYDDSQRFQTYVVKGQTPGSDLFPEAIANNAVGTAVDAGVTRNRTTVLTHESSATIAQCQKRAEWEASVRARESVDVKVSVRGWTKANGDLWSVGETLQCEATFIGLNQLMLITGVDYIKSKSEGTITSLTLSRPDAYQAKAAILPSQDPKPDLGHSTDVFKTLSNKLSEYIG